MKNDATYEKSFFTKMMVFVSDREQKVNDTWRRVWEYKPSVLIIWKWKQIMIFLQIEILNILLMM